MSIIIDMDDVTSINNLPTLGVFARWRHSAMKFLNKKLMTVFSI